MKKEKRMKFDKNHFDQVRKSSRREAGYDAQRGWYKLEDKAARVTGKVQGVIDDPVGAGLDAYMARRERKREAREKEMRRRGEKPGAFAKFRRWTKRVSNNLNQGGQNRGVLDKSSPLLQPTKGQMVSVGPVVTEKKRKEKAKIRKRVVTTYE